jgi:hypothetical protein
MAVVNLADSCLTMIGLSDPSSRFFETMAPSAAAWTAFGPLGLLAVKAVYLPVAIGGLCLLDFAAHHDVTPISRIVFRLGALVSLFVMGGVVVNNLLLLTGIVHR